MGRLIEGVWSDEWYKPDPRGRFVRESAKFHCRLTADGSSGFQAEADRYHLYVAWACPWAHRTIIVRKLRKLEDVISLSVVDPVMGPDGWEFQGAPGTIPDTVNGSRYLRDIYLLAEPKYTGRVSVPVMWDKQTRTIVCNESREIIRMLDVQFAAWGDTSVNFCPPELTDRITSEIDALYNPVNNGVYRAGFATTQQAYEEAIVEVFQALDRYEARLAEQRYLCGDRITEADWCFFTTLLRFDVVYHYHFKCNRKRIRDYPNIWNYLRDLYQVPGVSETCRIDHIKEHYFKSHPKLNPLAIVPLGPEIDFTEPHDRARFE
jgi:putative glutathione S-transferase